MLYVFFGTDTNKIANQATKLVDSLRSKQPNVQVFYVNVDEVPIAHMDELIDAQGLFVEKQVIVLKQPFVKAEGRDLVLERLERMAASMNIFVLTEGKLQADQKRALKIHAAQVEEHTRTQKQTKPDFALGDALGARDRKALWLEYTRAQRRGSDIEPLIGTLHWVIRSMLMTHAADNPDEAGMKPYSFQKAARFARNYTHEELLRLSHSLIALYHDARRGKHDLAFALERWVLTV